MTYLAQLKQAELHAASKGMNLSKRRIAYLQNHQNPPKAGCDGFVGTPPGGFEKSHPANPLDLKAFEARDTHTRALV